MFADVAKHIILDPILDPILSIILFHVSSIQSDSNIGLDIHIGLDGHIGYWIGWVYWILDGEDNMFRNICKYRNILSCSIATSASGQLT